MTAHNQIRSIQVANIQARTAAASAVPPPSLQALVSQTGNTPLFRVALAFVDKRINLYLRFGEPERTIQLDRWRRCAVFLPASIFCRVRWESNDYGTVRWQLMVIQACTPLDVVQRIPGVQPGAHILLHAETEQKVRVVLEKIDAIEALGIATIDVSPAYWGTLGNRLAAQLRSPVPVPVPLPDYTAERHTAWLAGRELQ